MSRDNYNPYRMVGAKKIDVWFYEEGDLRRTIIMSTSYSSYRCTASVKTVSWITGIVPTNCWNCISSRPISKFHYG